LIQELLKNADQLRREGRWREAIDHYKTLIGKDPSNAILQQNLAICFFATSQFQDATQMAMDAIHTDQTLWQPHILLGKIYKQRGDPIQAETCYQSALQLEPGNPEATLALADIALNEYGDVLECQNKAKTLLTLQHYQADAQLAILTSSLYRSVHSSQEISERFKNYAAQYLQDPSLKFTTDWHHQKKRIGVISPLLSASPVYFLTFQFFKEMAEKSDLIFFNRGQKSDWATEKLNAICTEWHEVYGLESQTLATRIHAAEIDVMFDCAGWTDPVVLQALSCKPAKQQLKWVGGQSVTTGLDCFDGWLGDRWQSPSSLQHLYTEPLINRSDDYASYCPPDYMPKALLRKKEAMAIFAHPAKLSEAFLLHLSKLDLPKVFIHRKYRHQVVNQRIRELVNGDISFIYPESHQEALNALNRCRYLLDTYPYTSGLTAREATALGLKIIVLQTGELFCQRHTARYVRI